MFIIPDDDTCSTFTCLLSTLPYTEGQPAWMSFSTKCARALPPINWSTAVIDFTHYHQLTLILLRSNLILPFQTKLDIQMQTCSSNCCCLLHGPCTCTQLITIWHSALNNMKFLRVACNLFHLTEPRYLSFSLQYLFPLLWTLP